MKIFKYEINFMNDPFVIDLPIGAEVLSFQLQKGKPFLWVKVDEYAETEMRHFRIFATGESISEAPPRLGHFVGTIQWDDFVWHLFEAR